MLKSLFGRVRGLKKNEKEVILAPTDGQAIPLSEVPDSAFCGGMLGKGVAILPNEGRVAAPAAGEVAVMFDTCHAVCIRTGGGAEIMIHVGLDTVQLQGKYFTAHVKQGDMVKAGDLLLEYDKDAIEKAGHNVVTPVVVCNTDEYAKVLPYTGVVKKGDILLELER